MLLWVWVQKTKDYTFCHSNGSLNNHDNRDVKMMIFRIYL